MYSEQIKGEIDALFLNLQKKAYEIIERSVSPETAQVALARVIKSEISAESGRMRDNLLYDLKYKFFAEPFFAESSERRNKLNRLHLDNEVRDMFPVRCEVDTDYKGLSRVQHSLCAAAVPASIGALAGLGQAVFSKKPYEISPMILVPIGIYLAVTLATEIIDYLYFSDGYYKKKYKEIIDSELAKAKTVYINWLNANEKEYRSRVEKARKQCEVSEYE